MDRGRWTHAP